MLGASTAAKRCCMERECARGDSEALHEWKCDDYNDAALEAARIAEEEGCQALELAT
tara:strand:+ start:275 stop:445 length:171 start_codon:yes stop_codon:yes gene_type:complete